jgi:A/G-specific adenine glycosylase
MYYIIAEHVENLLTKMRSEKDIWQNLHEFYLIESSKEISETEILEKIRDVFGDASILDSSKLYRQHLTHQTIKGKFFHIALERAVSIPGFSSQKRQDLRKIAFPRFITTYFQDSRLLS